MIMKTRFLLAALIAAGLASAPAAFAADDMSKAGMAKDKMEKKDTMSKPSDKMKTTGGMMDKKDSMSKDGMSKDGMKKQ
jgi:pentapeptide MXKDX repeat protein